MWLILDSLRNETDYDKNKQDFELFANHRMRLIYDDFHDILNKSVIHMNKSIMLN